MVPYCFSDKEIKILDQAKYISDDEYLRSIEGMVESIKTARNEPDEKGVALDKLKWKVSVGSKNKIVELT